MPSPGRPTSIPPPSPPRRSSSPSRSTGGPPAAGPDRTLRRRGGKRQPASPSPADRSLLLANLPVPYDALNGTGPDGRALWLRRTELGLDESWFGEPGPPPAEPVDLWDPAELSYSATLPAGGATLVIERHDGGDLDWFSADATGAIGGDTTAPATTRTTPGRLRYPSAPLPRWWQIEDAQVSIGGQAPDRAHLATLVLIDLIVNHSDDWFTFGFPARVGEIVTFEEVNVLDSFGDSWPLSPPSDWSLFTTAGLGSRLARPVGHGADAACRTRPRRGRHRHR